MPVLKWIAKMILIGISFPLLLFPFSPRPACLFLRNLFRFGVYSRPQNYKALRKAVCIHHNLHYRAPADRSYCLDVITPLNVSATLPVLFWLHGGAYVGGDKTDVEGYAVQIAAHGYVVVNVNYPLAPEFSYPNGVQAIADAYRFINENASSFPIDLSRIFFAGDSAGAQMAAQFLTAQLNESYAAICGIDQIVPSANLRGLVLFCGLYDAVSYGARFGSKHTPVSYIVKRIFWGVTGNPHWQDSAALYTASVIHHVPPTGFPPVFMTDGNVGTFTEQAKTYADLLRKNGTRVYSLFYPRSDALLPHEYQFHMRRREAIRAFQLLLEFLEEMKK